MKAEEVLSQLDDIVCDQLQVVTYKWLARHFQISYDASKQVLFKYLTRRKDKIAAIFYLSGWTKEQQSRHLIQLVPVSTLDQAKSGLASITGMHVYSVAPTIPKDPSEMYNTDLVQSNDMYKQLLQDTSKDGGSKSLLISNSLSSVTCAAVLYEPRQGTHKAVVGGGEASKPQAKEPVPKQQQQQRKAAAALFGGGAKKMTAVATKKKAPASKKQPTPMPPKKTEAPALSDSSSSSEDEEEDGNLAMLQPHGRKSGGVIDDSSDEEEKDKKEVEKEKEKEEKKQGGKVADKKKEGVVPAKRKQQKGKSPVKQKRKIMKTYYNDAGEEVTEMVEVSDAETEEEEQKEEAKKEEEETAMETGPQTKAPTNKAPTPSKKKVSPAKGGKGKPAAAANQRGIMSFFGKK